MLTALMVAPRAPAPHVMTLAFYEVSATIVPVLFLALIYQAGLPTRLGPGVFPTVVLGGILFAVVAEFNSLAVLARGYAVSGDLWRAKLSVGALGLMVVMDPALIAAHSFVNELSNQGESPSARLRWVSMVVVILGLIGAYLFEHLVFGL